MEIKYGEGKSEYGTGVEINLTGDEVATAIAAYIVAHGVHYQGPRTITVNGELCTAGRIYVDPSGFVIDADGKKFDGEWGEKLDAYREYPTISPNTACMVAAIIASDGRVVLGPHGNSCSGGGGGSGISTHQGSWTNSTVNIGGGYGGAGNVVNCSDLRSLQMSPSPKTSDELRKELKKFHP